MDFQIAGLPAHILLVHVVVVGIPLLAVLLVVLAAWPAARRVLWLPTVIGAFVLLGLTYLTIESGEWLEHRVNETPLIEAHTEQGKDIEPWAIGLTVIAVLIAVLAIVERRQVRRAAVDAVPAPPTGATASAATTAPRPTSTATAAGPTGTATATDAAAPPRARTARTVVSVLLTIAAVVVGAGATWTIIQIGDAGARAVWQGSYSDSPTGGGEGSDGGGDD